MTSQNEAAGLAGHLLEERDTRSARKIWQLVEDNIPYDDPPSTLK